MVEMAWLLDDPVLKKKAQGYIEYLIGSSRPDGSFGPTAEESEILRIGVQYLYIEGSCYIGIGILFLLYGFYRGIGKAAVRDRPPVSRCGLHARPDPVLAPVRSVR